MLWAILSCFLAAVLAPAVCRIARGSACWVFAILPFALTVHFLLLAPRVPNGMEIRESIRWVPSLGVELALRLDGLSLPFVLLATGIGGLVLIFAGSYMRGAPGMDRFYAILLVFLGAMLGLVLADDLIVLFVFWELTSIASFLLIGFDHELTEARSAARQALLVTVLGGLSLLAGLLLLGQAAGTYSLADLVGRGEAVRADPLYLPILLLIVVGAFAKSAQVPFHFWLPNAMQAPTPVSAYLHSATMVKAGIYLLARLLPTLGGTEAWILVLVIGGAATGLWGALIALQHTDMKRILAYTTIAALGQLVLLLGMGSTTAIKAALVFLLAHSLYKGALFLIAGAIDHATGTRDVLQLRGLWRAMPFTAAAAMLAGLSMAGLPPLIGFLGKEAVYSAKLDESGIASWGLAAVGLALNTLTFAVAWILTVRPFLGRLRPRPQPLRAIPFAMKLGPLVLAAGGLALGLMPGRVGDFIIEPALQAIAAAPETIDLTLWEGLEPALAMSAMTFALGLYVYASRVVIRDWLVAWSFIERWGPARWYVFLHDGVARLGGAQTRFLERSPLRTSLLAAFGLAAIAAGATLLLGGRMPAGATPALDGLVTFEGPAHVWALAGLIAVAAVAVVLTTSRLAAITSLGAAGIGLSLLYASLGAPDLAITQFLVETLIVIIVALVLVRMPSFDVERLPARWPRIRDAALAGALGAVLGGLTLASARTVRAADVSAFLVEQAVPAGFGRNIVNVILVDFRALDTFGEIVVIAVAGLGVHALLRLRYPDGGEGEG